MSYRRLIKPAMDRILALGALLFLSPVLGVTALLIRLESSGPAIFRQNRVGENGQIFRVMKFRSMPVDTPNLPSAEFAVPQVTRTGKVIRRLNIDELPQLFNVLRGEMSLVGPRPGLPSQTRLHEMRRANGSISCAPGLTGWAQVNSYHGMSEEEKARLDGEYHQKLSFLFDLKIVLMTIPYFLRKPPVY